MNWLTEFHKCCEIIVKNREVKALNYAVNYARYGMSISSLHEAKVQALYILNNIQYWRGEEATNVRTKLKAFTKEVD